MPDKYIVRTDMTKLYEGRTLHRIQLLQDISMQYIDKSGLVHCLNIEKGTLGGWIETSYNLGQRGTGWICPGAIACDNSKVRQNALVSGNAVISGCATVWGNSRVNGNAKIYGDTYISNSAIVCDNAVVCGRAIVEHFAYIYDNAEIRDYARVSSLAKVGGSSIIRDNADIGGTTDLMGNWDIGGFTKLSATDQMTGLSEGCLRITSHDDVISIAPNTCDKKTMTFIRSEDGIIYVCQGYRPPRTIDEFCKEHIQSFGLNNESEFIKTTYAYVREVMGVTDIL